MRRIAGCFPLLCLLLPFSAVSVADEAGIRFAFASVPEGVQLLRTRDDYVRRLSPFDRAARVKTDRAVSEEEYLAFVAKSVLPWQPREREKLDSVLRELQPRFAALSLRLPKAILLVKTTGDEEGGVGYTRGNAIFLPAAYLEMPSDRLAWVISHEVFHVLMRQNADLRDRLYRIIGYEKTNEIEFPPSLARRKITNPDAPVINHRIRARLDDRPVWVVPVLFSDSEKYSPARGGTFFDYLQFRFMLVEESGPGGRAVPAMRGLEPVLVRPDELGGFLEQVGRNTNYLIHPEETLADNFALLVTGRTGMPNPEIPARIRDMIVRYFHQGW